MSLSPAVIVHGLEEACAVLALALPVTLLSPPGAAAGAGCGWWRALVAQAGNACPQARFTDLLDCGEASGQALAALRIGQNRLVLAQWASGWDAVAAIAAAQGGRLLAVAPPALDMAHSRTRLQLRDWLQLRTATGDSRPSVS